MKTTLRFVIMLTITAALCLCLGAAVYAGDTVPPDPVIHTVTLDANGGYFDDDPSCTAKEFEVMDGQDLYPISPKNPDPHLACSGWYYDAACTELAAGFTDGLHESFTPEDDVTLYAGWAEAWVVTFDANGGTLESDNTYSVVKGERLAYYPFLRPADPNRMRFSHWALADGTRVDVWTYIPEGDVTLYAHYVPVHNVTLDANGGYFSNDPSVTTVVHQITDGEALYSPAPNNPDTHLAFSGWYYDEACTELAVGRYGTFIPDRDLTLYAGWTEAWVVTFDANGSSFGSGKTAMEYAVAKGSKLSYDPSQQLIAPDQMRFSYWMLEDGTRVNAWEYIPEGDVTLYARYGRVHHVTLDANGGYFGDDYSTTLERQVTDGQSIILKPPPKNPDPHLACSGWYYDAACTELAAGVVDGAYESFTPENDVTLYAGWDEGWIVTFEAGDGQFPDGTSTDSVTLLKGMILEYYPYPYMQPKESHNWFDFYCREDGTRFEYCREDGWGTVHYSRTFVPEGDMTLYAHYSHFYEVTLDANGGYFPDDPNRTTLGGLMAESGANDPGEYMPKHFNPHMVFDGWYYDAACTNLAAARDEPVAPHGDVTLYAGWLSPDVVLPADLTTIEAEAFNGGAFTYVLVPDGVEAIGSGAFANCPSLQYVEIQGVDTAISDNAFGGRTDITIIAPAGSAAATWANQHYVNFIPAA